RRLGVTYCVVARWFGQPGLFQQKVTLSDKRFKHVLSATRVGMRLAREPAEGSVDLTPRISDAQAEGCRGSMDLIPRIMSGALGGISGVGQFGRTAAMEKHLVILSAPLWPVSYQLAIPTI